ncbi:hypothetical protein C8R43DRAFT_1002171 [Mycena crocata]|nr:hypothetical protein C8R43DRAFT_1002171 [Mycena crocata]
MFSAPVSPPRSSSSSNSPSVVEEEESLPEYVALKGVLKAVSTAVESGTPIHLNIRISSGWEAIQKLQEKYPRLRLGYDRDTHEFLIKYMPSAPHERATGMLSISISDYFLLQQQQSIMAHCCHGGTTRFKVSERGRLKEADLCYMSNLRPEGALPALVVERGVSETYKQLKRDCAWWLETGEVKLVILIIVKRSAISQLSIELWQPIPNSQLPRAHSKYIRPNIPQQRGHRLVYLRGQPAPPLVLDLADFGIVDGGILTIPMDTWSTTVWATMP